MARRSDTGWRDPELVTWHSSHGFECPAAGMTMPMIEYDRGQSVGIVNYIPRGNPLPQGDTVGSTYRAFARLYNDTGGAPLPFLTAQYDPRNWAMKVFPHNLAGRRLLGISDATPSWQTVTEERFAEILFAMRKRHLPDLFGYGVEFSTGEWMKSEYIPAAADLPFPCADMSARRRIYEPAVSTPMRLKVPCLDVDLSVIDQDGNLALVVDYKRRGAICDINGTNATALASLAGSVGLPVPAFMTRYWGDGDAWWFETHALNRSAERLLAYVLGKEVLSEWTALSEGQWLDVLRCARDV